MLNYFRSFQGTARQDVLSGLTVALALVPEAIAFAFVAGVSPLIGLYSAFFLGLITAVAGGRPGMISGATGAMAVVVTGLVALHGVPYLFYAVLLCGAIQITLGLLRLGKLIRLVPHPVMLGFVNGLAIVIGMAQLGSFKTLSIDGTLDYMGGTRLAVMAMLVVATMGIIYFLPRLTSAVPASLAAILTVTFLAAAINSQTAGENLTPTVRDMLVTNTQAKAVRDANKVKTGELIDEVPAPDGFRLVPVVEDSHDEALRLDDAEVASAIASVEPGDVGLKGGLPIPFLLEDYTLPPLSLETLWIILPFSLILAGVGLIESLMTLSLIDEITQTRGRGNRECIGQGLANVICGFFGGMGGCAMIGQSLINVNSGGRGRLSGITAAVCLLLFVLFLAPLIEQIPMAALVGVMFMVVIGTFEWASLRMFTKMPAADVAVMVLVTAYTVVMHDLATAVILGVVVSALVFAWKHATHIAADVSLNEFGSKIYQLHGPLFFASVSEFKGLFDPAGDPDDVVIDFYYTRVYDQSGLEAIHKLAEQYESAGKRLHLTHLSQECRTLLDRAGEFVEVNLSEDPQYHVATDRLG